MPNSVPAPSSKAIMALKSGTVMEKILIRLVISMNHQTMPMQLREDHGGPGLIRMLPIGKIMNWF